MLNSFQSRERTIWTKNLDYFLFQYFSGNVLTFFFHTQLYMGETNCYSTVLALIRKNYLHFVDGAEI